MLGGSCSKQTINEVTLIRWTLFVGQYSPATIMDIQINIYQLSIILQQLKMDQNDALVPHNIIRHRREMESVTSTERKLNFATFLSCSIITSFL